MKYKHSLKFTVQCRTNQYMLLHPSFRHSYMRSQSDQYDCRSHHWNKGQHHRGRPLHGETAENQRVYRVRRISKYRSPNSQLALWTHSHVCKTWDVRTCYCPDSLGNPLSSCSQSGAGLAWRCTCFRWRTWTYYPDRWRWPAQTDL